MQVDNNPFPKVILVEGSAPAAPSGGQQSMYIDSATHTLKAINSSGAISAVGSAQASFSWVNKSGNYGIATSDSGVLVDATSANITATLPTAVGATQRYAIAKKDSSAHTVTVATTSSQTIGGASTVVLTAQNQCLEVESDGANWYVASQTSQGSFAATVTAPAYSASGLTGAVSGARFVGATASGAPASGTFLTGDYIVDQSGAMYVCTSGGTSGTWTKIGGGNSPAILLNYNATTDLWNPFTPSATYADFIANQSFTVVHGTGVVVITVAGASPFEVASVSAQLVIDSAGTPTTVHLCGNMFLPNYQFLNLFSGAQPVYLSGLTVGAHTVKIQVASVYQANNAVFLRCATYPLTEFLRMTVVEYP